MSQEETQDLLDRATLLEAYVSDKFYGDWYHNTALIVLTAFYSWLVARLGGGIAWLAIVLAFTATIYRTSIRRLRSRVRDDLLRESSLRKLESDQESMEWMNSFLVKFWLIYEPVLSEMVVSQANNILAGQTPSFIEGLSIDTFTLGTKPPRIEFVRTHPRTDEDIVVMDWRASFIPNDTQDLTYRQLKNKVNPKVVLAVRIGKGALSKSIKINVEDMMFSGTARIRMKLITMFPHIKTVDLSFLQPPEFDFSLKPVGADITAIPGLKSFIESTTHETLGPMLYAPNSYQINIQELLAGVVGESAIGVLAITVFNAHGLKGSEALGNTVDPYAVFSINNREELARTKVIHETKNPTWNETKYILINNLSETLTVSIFDYNDIRKDKLIGVVNIPLETLETDPDQENLNGEVRDGGKPRGALNYQLHWYPVLEGRKLEDGTIEPPPESRTGILKFWVHQAKDLDATKSMVGQLSPYSDMLINGNLIHQSKSLKRINNPVWDDNFEFLVTDKHRCMLGVRIKDSRGLATDPVIGTYQISLEKLLASLEKGDDWFNLTPTGRVRLGASWKPVALKGGDAMRNYVEPIGVIRLHLIKGTDMRNLETIGKVDPYVRVFLNGFQRGRTIGIDDTLNPVWDEIIYIPVSSAGQRLLIEAMDVENLGKDRTLGHFELNTSDFIKSDENGNYLPYEESSVRTSMFVMKNKKPKGTLHYTISFYPSVRVMNPDDAKQKAKEAAEKAAEKAKAEAEGKSDDKKDDDTATLAENEQKVEEDELPDIPLDELVKSQSGVLAITFLNANIRESNTYIRVLSDANINPSYSTPRIQNRTQDISETGEVSILELDWSRLRFQLVTKVNKPKKDDFLGTCEMPTLSVLKSAYYEPHTIKFKDEDGKIVGSVNIRTRYFPLLMEPDLSESINNMGTLKVEVINAENVPAADRNGYSDPYAVVVLNGEKILKTDKNKKTLNPVWNEKVTTEIASRTAAKFAVEIWDWDMGRDDDFLGKATIDLAKLEPLKPANLSLPLEEAPDATVHLRLYFEPSYVIRRVNSSGIGGTLSSGAALPGKIIVGAAGAGATVVGAGASAAGAVVGGVADGVGGVLGGIKGGASKLFKGKSDKNRASSGANFQNQDFSPKQSRSSSDNSDNNTSRQALGHRKSGSIVSNDDSSTTNNASLLRMTITGASGYPVGHLQIRASLIGKKEKELLKSKNYKNSGTEGEFKIEEITSFRADSSSQLLFKVYEHKKLGRSEELGEATVAITHFESGKPTTVAAGPGNLTVTVDINS